MKTITKIYRTEREAERAQDEILASGEFEGRLVFSTSVDDMSQAYFKSRGTDRDGFRLTVNFE